MPTPFDDAVKAQKFSGYGSDLFNAAFGNNNQHLSPIPGGPLDTFTKSQHTSFNDLVKAQKASTGYDSDLFNAALGSSNQQISPLPNGPLDKLTNPNVSPKADVPDNPNLNNSVFGGQPVRTDLEIMWSNFLRHYPNIGAALEAMGEHPIATAAGATLVGLGMYAAAKKWRDYVNSNKSEDATTTVRECNTYNSKLNSYFADYLTEDSGAYKIISNKSALRSKREAVLASINEDSSYFINDTIGLLNEEGVITDALSNVWSAVKGVWPAFTRWVAGYPMAADGSGVNTDHRNKTDADGKEVMFGLNLPGKVEALGKWLKDNPNATAAGLAGAGLLGTYYLFKKFLGKKKFDNNDIAMSQKIDKMDPKKVSSISI